MKSLRTDGSFVGHAEGIAAIEVLVDASVSLICGEGGVEDERLGRDLLLRAKGKITQLRQNIELQDLPVTQTTERRKRKRSAA